MTKDIAARWYVMTHLDMRRFLEWLKNENAQRLRESRTIVEPFYPNDYLRKRPDASADSDAVGERPSGGRSEARPAGEGLGRFVFLRTTAADLESLVNAEHNFSYARARLCYYADTDGSRATVPDGMMQNFLQACMKYGGQFEITPPIRSIETMDKVKIMSGPFAGHEASVVRVNHSHGAIHLDLAIQLVSGAMNIRMCNVSKNQILILNREAGDAIRADFIEYTQNHLLRILEHRIKRVDNDEVNRRDVDMLTRLYRYRHHEVKNESAYYHFLALMLICAHLCRYTAYETELREQLLEILTAINQRSESKAATDTRTYLWIALYISTHHPSYRDAAKRYVREHQPKSAKLRRFVSLIRTGVKV